MKDYNDQDYKRQLIIANSLFEMGIDNDLIKLITTIKEDELIKYREENNKNKKIIVDLDKKNKI